MYIYESHLGGLYTTEHEVDWDALWCEQCGDSDNELGWFENPKDFLKYYANNIDCNDGNGGYHIDYVFEDVLIYFDEEISMEEAIEIVKVNRTWEDDEE